VADVIGAGVGEQPLQDHLGLFVPSLAELVVAKQPDLRGVRGGAEELVGW
jgi:hypothetical protein